MRTHSPFMSIAAMLMNAVPLCAQTAGSAAGAPAPGQMPNFTGAVASVDASDVRGVVSI